MAESNDINSGIRDLGTFIKDPNTLIERIIGITAGFGAINGLYPVFFQTVSDTFHSDDTSGFSSLIFDSFIILYFLLPVIVFGLFLYAMTTDLCECHDATKPRSEWPRSSWPSRILWATVIYMVVSVVAVLIGSLLVGLCLLILVSLAMTGYITYIATRQGLYHVSRNLWPAWVALIVMIVGILVFQANDITHTAKKGAGFYFWDKNASDRYMATDTIGEIYTLNDQLDKDRKEMPNLSNRYYLKSQIDQDVRADDEDISPVQHGLDKLAETYIREHEVYNIEPHLELLNTIVLGRDNLMDTTSTNKLIGAFRKLFDTTLCIVVTDTQEIAKMKQNRYGNNSSGRFWWPLDADTFDSKTLSLSQQFTIIDKYLRNVVGFDSILLISADKVKPAIPSAELMKLKGQTKDDPVYLDKAYNYIAAHGNLINSRKLSQWVDTYTKYRSYKVKISTDRYQADTVWIWRRGQFQLLLIFAVLLYLVLVIIIMLNARIACLSEKRRETVAEIPDDASAEVRLLSKISGYIHPVLSEADQGDIKELGSISRLRSTLISFAIVFLLMILPLYRDLSRVSVQVDSPSWMTRLPSWSLTDYVSTAYAPAAKDRDKSAPADPPVTVPARISPDSCGCCGKNTDSDTMRMILQAVTSTKDQLRIK